MYFKRQIEEQLEKWKVNPNSKPLIIRGARQTGKTTSVKKFAQTYQHSILLDLEKDSDISYFNNFSDVTTIAEALFLSSNIPFEICFIPTRINLFPLKLNQEKLAH